MVRANKDKQLKVLLVNGSPHRSGNTFTALSEVAETLEEEDIKTASTSVTVPYRGVSVVISVGKKVSAYSRMRLTRPCVRNWRKRMASSSVRQSISVDHREVSVPCSTACSIPAAGWHSTSRRHPWWSAVAEEPPPLSTG